MKRERKRERETERERERERVNHNFLHLLMIQRSFWSFFSSFLEIKMGKKEEKKKKKTIINKRSGWLRISVLVVPKSRDALQDVLFIFIK